MNISILVSKLLSMTILGCIGYTLARFNVLKRNDKATFTVLINKVCLPMLLFTSISSIRLNTQTLIHALVIFIFAYLCMLANYLYASYLSQKHNLKKNQRCVLINGAVHANVAFFAFPILYALFQEAGIFYGAIYFLADSTILWTIGIKRFVLSSEDSSSKKRLNIVTTTLIISLVFMTIGSLFNLDYQTNLIFSTFSDVGKMTTNLALIFLGLTVFESQLVSLFKNVVVLKLLFFKMIVLPIIIGLGIVLILPNLDSLVMTVIIIQVAMPPFASLVTLSFEYKQDMHFASSLVVIGHILTIITLPFIFYIINLF